MPGLLYLGAAKIKLRLLLFLGIGTPEQEQCRCHMLYVIPLFLSPSGLRWDKKIDAANWLQLLTHIKSTARHWCFCTWFQPFNLVLCECEDALVRSVYLQKQTLSGRHYYLKVSALKHTKLSKLSMWRPQVPFCTQNVSLKICKKNLGKIFDVMTYSKQWREGFLWVELFAICMEMNASEKD